MKKIAPSGTREWHLAKFLAAADKHLPDYTPEQKATWAESALVKMAKRGQIIVVAQ